MHTNYTNIIKKIFLIWIAKLIFYFSKTFNLGAGQTWPGEIALKFDKNILKKIAPEKIILVAGTNGKTTTSLLIKTILEKNGQSVVYNKSGANLLNGIVSSLLISPKAEWGVLECDENTLPQILKQITPDIVVLLNLFRDQLDRYGEVDAIAQKWLGSLGALVGLGKETTVIINADDPQLVWIGKNLNGNVKYFGLEDKSLYLNKIQHATDSTYCPKCGAKLVYEGVYFSHLGVWECRKCGLRRPKIDWGNWGKWGNWGELAGVYNRYNVLAAVMAAQEIGIKKEIAEKGLNNFKPAFGRQEEIEVKGKKVRIILSKNPAGFNESLRTLKEFPGQKNLLLILNDRIPDGRDVSWIWDVDFETISPTSLGVSGDRAYDLGLRLKYAGVEKFKVYESLKEGIKEKLEEIKGEETLYSEGKTAKSVYILATYSAMLEVRKILTGRKLL